MTALSLPCPRPVAPRLPNSSARIAAVDASTPLFRSSAAKRPAARMGPTVCELDWVRCRS